MSAVTGCPLARPLGSTTGVRTPCNHGASTRCRARTVSPISAPLLSSHSPAGHCSPMGCQTETTGNAYAGLLRRRLGVRPGRSGGTGSVGVDRPAALVPAARPTPLPDHSLVRNDNTAISMGVDHG